MYQYYNLLAIVVPNVDLRSMHGEHAWYDVDNGGRMSALHAVVRKIITYTWPMHAHLLLRHAAPVQKDVNLRTEVFFLFLFLSKRKSKQYTVQSARGRERKLFRVLYLRRITHLFGSSRRGLLLGLRDGVCLTQ